MKSVAIGFRMHSGWGALVTVANSTGIAEVIDRRRVAIAARGDSAAKQPYHFAKDLNLLAGEKFLNNCFAASEKIGSAVIRELVCELTVRDYCVVGAAILRASGRPLPPFSKIRASHALIHAAEGEFFRDVVWKACESLDIAVIGIPERDLNERVRTAFGEVATRLCLQISTLGRLLGPPWTKDQKTAALAALVVLANNGPAFQSSLRRRSGCQDNFQPHSDTGVATSREASSELPKPTRRRK